MPVAHADLVARPSSPDAPRELPFPPVTKSHILNCSYHFWYSKYRSHVPKARLIGLTPPFLSYLRADGIRLPPDEPPPRSSDDINSSSDEDDDDEPAEDPSQAWSDIHQKIRSTIAELNGSVVPKLNWSAPKDATWITATNSMECRTPYDVYLLLKSSDFITHDLEQVLDDCESDDDGDEDSDDADGSSEEDLDEIQYKEKQLSKIPYYLILRKTVPNFNPALEFRCFVRSRHLLCICQRDLNHFSFLPALVSSLRSCIQDFFSKNLQQSFPDENFTFDVYIPPPHNRVWLIDINPWAPRTDPLLFSWLEILNMRGGENVNALSQTRGNGVIRIPFRPNPSNNGQNGSEHQNGHGRNDSYYPSQLSESVSVSDEDEEAATDDNLDTVFTPEFRLVNRDDPEAYRFNTPQYSAHKLPKDVVDASADGEAGLREFMGTWREIISRQEREDEDEATTEA